mmetsp:Transcript_118970/g.333223  ORF Transcript_118970/g.333223 Transcript_118970/m.333223 type:complete len:97 (+) Transcript_118970:396-686(+)
MCVKGLLQRSAADALELIFCRRARERIIDILVREVRAEELARSFAGMALADPRSAPASVAEALAAGLARMALESDRRAASGAPRRMYRIVARLTSM